MLITEAEWTIIPLTRKIGRLAETKKMIGRGREEGVGEEAGEKATEETGGAATNSSHRLPKSQRKKSRHFSIRKKLFW